MTTVQVGFGAQFTGLCEAPGLVVHQTPLDGSPARGDIPQIFLEAFSVRKAVFVDEQGCSVLNEIDSDDGRSFHWVAYASINNKNIVRADGRRISESGKLAIATVRLVPAPHPKHPAAGSVDGLGGIQVQPVEGGTDQATALHDGKESYVKLGRLATLIEYRGMGLGRLLINTALEYIRHNADKAIVGPKDPIEREREHMLTGRPYGHWKGLVMVHAQKSVVKFYESLGFVEDPELGEWIEEGLVHVAMWNRLTLPNH